MDPVERSQQRVDELRALLRDLRAARADVPSLSRPTGSVGALGTSTGTAADRLHRDELVPLSGSLSPTLQRAEQAIEDELSHALRAHDRLVLDGRAGGVGPHRSRRARGRVVGAAGHGSRWHPRARSARPSMLEQRHRRRPRRSADRVAPVRRRAPAEELVQHALMRTFVAWSTARERDPLAYARRTLANLRDRHAGASAAERSSPRWRSSRSSGVDSGADVRAERDRSDPRAGHLERAPTPHRRAAAPRRPVGTGGRRGPRRRRGNREVHCLPRPRGACVPRSRKDPPLSSPGRGDRHEQ